MTEAIADAEQMIHSDNRSAFEALMKYSANRLEPQLAAATIAVYSPARKSASFNRGDFTRQHDLPPPSARSGFLRRQAGGFCR